MCTVSITIFISIADHDIRALVRCFRTNIGPNVDIDKAIKEEKQYLNNYNNPKSCKWSPWIKALLSFFIPFAIYSADLGTDSLSMIGYHNDWKNGITYTNHTHKYSDSDCTINSNFLKTMAEVPQSLSTEYV